MRDPAALKPKPRTPHPNPKILAAKWWEKKRNTIELITNILPLLLDADGREAGDGGRSRWFEAQNKHISIRVHFALSHTQALTTTTRHASNDEVFRKI